MMTSFLLNIPIKIVSEANINKHWRDRYGRAKKQKAAVAAMWAVGSPEVTVPCIVKLTRRSPRKLDDDNLRTAFKAIRDAVADSIVPGLQAGRADGYITWEYDQVKDKVHSVDVEVRCGTDVFQ